MPRAPLRSSAPRAHEVAFARSMSALADRLDAALDRLGPQLAMATAGAERGWLEPERPAWQASVEAPAVSPSSRPRSTDEPSAAGSYGTDSYGAESAATGPADDAVMDADHVETWQLVSRAQGGDGEAFGILYDRYVDVVFRFIYYRVNDRALAEDFTSETFLRALRRIGSITYQGRDIGAWFVTIARNIVLDHMKSARNRLETTTADTIESREYERSTETAVLETLQSERLMQAVGQLGEEQRECIMLRFIQGLSVSETAAVMGKNDGAIKALQHRAVRKLADLVAQELR